MKVQPSQLERRLNILLVAPWLPNPNSAGVQSSAGSLTEGLSDRHNVTLLTPSLGSEKKPTKISDHVTVYRMRSPLPIKLGRFNLKASIKWLIFLPAGHDKRRWYYCIELCVQKCCGGEKMFRSGMGCARCWEERQIPCSAIFAK